MHSRARFLVSNLILALALLAACVSTPAGRAPLTLTLLHTNDTLGYLRACG